MSLLDNNYDFDAIESTIDFKVKWHDPINHIWGKNDTTTFNLPKDIIYRNGFTLLRLDISLIDKKVLREYITKLKEHYSIFSNRVLQEGDNLLYNHFGCYEVKIHFNKNTISINAVQDSGMSNDHPAFRFTLEDGRITVKGTIENDILYNVLCEIEKGLD